MIPINEEIRNWWNTTRFSPIILLLTLYIEDTLVENIIKQRDSVGDNIVKEKEWKKKWKIRAIEKIKVCERDKIDRERVRESERVR